MSADEQNNQNQNATAARPRRGSLTSNTFAAIFGRSNSTSSPPSHSSNQPTPANPNQAQQRRLSITTLGLSGTSPIQPSPFGMAGARRTSVSTAGSDSVDESAIEDDDGPGRSIPTTPFGRRLSFGAQALFNARGGGGSPGTSGRTPPNTTVERKPSQSQKAQASTQSQSRTTSDFSTTRSGEGLNWSEQFRSRAESAVSRPSFSTSPSNSASRPLTGSAHERAKSIGDMPAPPASSIPAQPSPQPQSALRRKPDAVGERILRGDFYMD